MIGQRITMIFFKEKFYLQKMAPEKAPSIICQILHVLLSLPDQLKIAMNVHIITGNKTTGFCNRVPFQSKILSVDLSVNAETRTRVSPWIFDHTAKFDIEFYFFGNVTNGQVTIQFIRAVVVDILVFCRGEFYLRVLVCVKEIICLQVPVTLSISGCYRINIGREMYFCSGEIFVLGFRLHSEFGKRSAYVCNHHMS